MTGPFGRFIYMEIIQGYKKPLIFSPWQVLHVTGQVEILTVLDVNYWNYKHIWACRTSRNFNNFFASAGFIMCIKSVDLDHLALLAGTWVKDFRIIPEFRILRLTFQRKSASKSWYKLLWFIFSLSKDNWPFKLEFINICRHAASFKNQFKKFRILEILNFHPCSHLIRIYTVFK